MSEVEDLTRKIDRSQANAEDLVERWRSFRSTLISQDPLTEELAGPKSSSIDDAGASTSPSLSQPTSSFDVYPVEATLTEPTTFSSTDEYGISGLRRTDSTEALWNSESDRSSESSMSSSMNLPHSTNPVFNHSIAEGFGCHLPVYDDSLKESHDQELLAILAVKDEERPTVLRKLKAASGTQNVDHLL